MLSNPSAQRFRDAHPERDRAQRRAATKRWYIKNRDAQRINMYFRNLWVKYKITRIEYERLLSEQEGKCKICDKLHEWTRFGKLNVDHNHITGEVRGLLCSACNKGLGNFKDDLQLLKKAIDYIGSRQMAESLQEEQISAVPFKDTWVIHYRSAKTSILEIYFRVLDGTYYRGSLNTTPTDHPYLGLIGYYPDLSRPTTDPDLIKKFNEEIDKHE